MNQANILFRHANEDNVPLILDFIFALAEYEHMSDQVIASEALLREWIFEQKKSEVIFVCTHEKDVGFALFFTTFLPFWGGPGYIWKTFLSFQVSAEKSMERLCSPIWLP